MRPEASADVSPPIDATPPKRFSRRWKRVIGAAVVVALLVVSATGVAVAWLSAGLERGERLAKEGRWDDASKALSRYLWLWPDDTEARLLAAEALYRAGSEPGEREAAARESLSELQHIPDDSREGPEARVRAAGILLTILKRPHAAELQLRRAIAHDVNWIKPHILLWQVLDATGRSDFAEPTVREVIRLSPPDQKILHLRSWYLSQFAPAAANLDLDRVLGVVKPGEVPTVASEAARYELFRAAEPESPIHVAAAARLLLLRKNQARRATEMLDEFAREHVFSDRFFAAVRAEAAYAAGDMAILEEVMQQWPHPREGYDFNKWEGVRLEEIADDPAAAAAAYREALQVWPGQVDWQAIFRLSTCLRRLGKVEEAERLKSRSDEIGKLIGEEYHRPLREALANLADLAPVEQSAEFYEKIDRPWEAGLWREHAKMLRQHESANPDEPTNILSDAL